MRDLVERDPGPELGGVEGPVALERRDVRRDEQDRGVARSRDGDVVLAEHVLREEPQDAADLRAEQQG